MDEIMKVIYIREKFTIQFLKRDFQSLYYPVFNATPELLVFK